MGEGGSARESKCWVTLVLTFFPGLEGGEKGGEKFWNYGKIYTPGIGPPGPG